MDDEGRGMLKSIYIGIGVVILMFLCWMVSIR